MVLVPIVLFAIGLVVLVKASDEAVLRGVRLAKLTGLSEVAIGFILLAIGTSLPELAVSVFSSFAGESQIAFGTLLGSNISDVTLIFGITALFGTIVWKKADYEVSRSALIPILLALLALFMPVLDANFGILALAVFLMFVFAMIREKYAISRNHEKVPIIKTPKIVTNIVVMLTAIVLVVVSAYLITNSSVDIARAFGIPEILISGIIIAVGTSIPELAVSIQAIRNGRSGLAIGNIAGSLVTNLGFILGIAAIMRPIQIMPLDRAWLVASLVTGLVFLWLSGRRKLSWRGGIGLIFLWLATIVTLAILGF